MEDNSIISKKLSQLNLEKMERNAGKLKKNCISTLLVKFDVHFP